MLLALGIVVRWPPVRLAAGNLRAQIGEKIGGLPRRGLDGPEVDRFMLAILSETQGILSVLARRC
jgi:hypothetical protein